METSTNDEQSAGGVYENITPTQEAENTFAPNDPETNNDPSAERKKYHSSAMYAASKWHNTVSHVKAHSNKGLDL